MDTPRYLDFLNPIHMTWRKGTVDDPYIERVDILPVINQRIQLLEVPDKLSRVRIPRMKEINYKTYVEKKLNKDEFYVDYSNGMVFFHSSQEGKTLTIEYKGRGFIAYPSSRIYHYDKETNVVTSLQDIAQIAIDKISEMEQAHLDLSDLKLQLIDAINDSHVTGDELRKIIEQALIAIDLVEDAYRTGKLIYKPYVQTFNDILTTYPYPEVGWTVQVYDTGVRYRWDGAQWTPIDLLGGNVPLANEELDGLMSKEDFIKLKSLPQEEIDKLKNITEYVDTRPLLFVISAEVVAGVQEPHIYFPFNYGYIENITASVAKTGSADTAIRVEKSTDYSNWTNITPTPLLIKAGEHFDDGQYSISDRVVKRGEIFRLYIPYSSDIANLNLIILIKILKEIDG